ncbi:MAG TPA: hypothetical protein VLF64_01270 [Candidatus Saccharimonadales bacterium]|nr:hypothetical protein [Candidatus Saccharimonadales bacterium]
MKAFRTILTLSAIIAFGFFSITPVLAADNTSVSAQGYAAPSPVDIGAIVTLNKDTQSVVTAKQAQLQNMFGVAVDRNQLAFAVSNSTVQNETYVAVSGTYNVLVSTQGGAIESGDYVTLSSVDGIGMKASTADKTVFGRAAASFDGKTLTLGKTELKDSSGAAKTVTLGTIPVTINIERNPNVKSTKVNVPNWLERFGVQIAEKQISPIRIYLSMGITAVSLITAIVMLYAGVRNAIIAIGRNPMTKRSIFRALLEVILTSILILVIGLFAVYLLLKL